MKTTLTSSVAIAALCASAAAAEDITVFGPWLGPDQALVEQVLSDFAEKSGHNVSYVGSDSFEQQIVVDAEAGSAPNVAVFPQPGLASDMAGRGFLTPLRDGTSDWVSENYAAGQSWVDLGTYAGPDGEEDLYGFFYKVDVKSLVWYSPENFEDAGYEVPETMEELKALSEQMVADGETPWCIGLGSGGATGWPATDWVEDMMLRTQPPEVYDQWVSNEIPFDDPRVVGASRNSARLPAMTIMSPVALVLLPRPISATAPRVSLRHPRSATCTVRHRSSRPSSPKAQKLAQMRISSTFRPMRARTLAHLYWVRGHFGPSPTKTKRRMT